MMCNEKTSGGTGRYKINAPKKIACTKTLNTRVSYIGCDLFPLYAAALCSASYKKPQVS